MRSFVVALALSVALAPVGARTSPQGQPVFRSATHLIVQAVTVKDRNGKPVRGLTAKDFVVTENGQPQDVAFAEYQAIDADAAPAAAGAPPQAPTPAQTVTPPQTVAAQPRLGRGVSPVTETMSLPGSAAYRGHRLLILYFDLYNMPFFDRLRVFDNAVRYVDQHMTPADLVALLLFDGAGVQVKENFTSDRARLRERLDALIKDEDDRASGVSVAFDPGSAFGEDSDTFNIFATDRQLSALQTAVTDLGALPELKTLVYFGSGLQLNGTDNLAQLRATVNAAVRANVTLNPIDARGLVASAPMGDATRASPGGIGMFSGTIAQAGIAAGQGRQDTLYALAKDTGGKAMFDNNDLSLGIAQAAQAVTGYYLIGYYTTNPAKDGRLRRVNVRLAAGLAGDLSYRAAYYGDKEYAKFTRTDKERQLSEALRLEDPITDIPMAMEVNYFQISSAEYYVPVSIRMPGSELARAKPGASTHAAIDMIGEIKDEYGVTIQNARDTLQFTVDAAHAAEVARRPLQYETGYTLLPGSYVIKMLARDATTGHIGTYQRAFVVPNLEKVAPQLPISSVVLTNQRQPVSQALLTVKQKVQTDAVNPLIANGVRLIPGVGRTFSVSRPLYVYLQAYERDATAMRPLVAFVTLYRDGVKTFESDPLTVDSGWDAKSHAVPLRLTLDLSALAPASYDCQVTVLDPSTSRAGFWRGTVELVRQR